MAEVKAVAWGVEADGIAGFVSTYRCKNEAAQVSSQWRGGRVVPLVHESALAALRHEVTRRSQEQGFVWSHLQKVSPWSESNDMLWSDEIMIGIDLLEQRATDAESRSARLEADNARLRGVLGDLLDLPAAQTALRYLDRGVGTTTNNAAWLRARAALAEKEGGL